MSATPQLSRPRRRPPSAPEPEPPPSVTVLGILAALRSAGLGVLAVMVVVLVGWATAADSGADAADAVKTALMAWLVAHRAHLTVPGGELALVPLGLTLLPLVLLHTATLRAGRSAGVRGRAGVLALTGSVTATYAVLATLLSLLARTGAVQAVPETAFLGAAAVAAVGAATGAVRATGSWAGLARRLPPLVRAALPAASAALAVLLGGGALLVGASLGLHVDRASGLVRALDAGAGGTLLLGLLCLLYVPTAAVWGLAYAVGPGFAVGAGTSVSVAGTTVGAVPAFPLLAALPAGAGTGVGWLGLAVPLAAGALAGAVTHRRSAAAPGWRPLAELAGAAGALVAGAVAVLALAASGPAGPGRMAQTGPTWWLVALAAGLEVAAVMGATTALLRRR